MGRTGTRRRLLLPALVTLGSILALAVPAWAGVTWDPSATARVANRPRTCNTPGSTCTDSGSTSSEGPTSIAVSNNGTTHYLHTLWATAMPSGDIGNGSVDFTTGCSTRNDPKTGVPPYCSGVYYARSSDDGATWNGGAAGTDATRIGPGTSHIQRGAIAAAGSYVYVAYVTTVGYQNKMCAKSPRVLYVVANSNYGAAGSWGAPVQLTSSSGRVDYPSINASGSDVYVVHTDSDTGQVVFDRSTDNGTSFSPQGIGWTTNTFDNQTSPGTPKCPSPPSPSGLEGYDGAPVVAGDGTTVAATWVRDTGGKVVAKVSIDGGISWPGGGNGKACVSGDGICSQTLTRSGALGPSGGNHPAEGRGAIDVAAASGRVAFAWKDNAGANTPKGVYVRLYLAAGGWAPSRLISCLQTGGPCAGKPAPLVYDDAFSPSIAMYGTTGMGLAWSACPYAPTDPATPCNDDPGGKNMDPGAEVLWKESWDNGATWWAGVSGSYELLADNAYGGSEVNEFPTVVYDKPAAAAVGCAQGAQGPEVGCTRYVMYTGRTRTITATAVYISKGTQT